MTSPAFGGSARPVHAAPITSAFPPRIDATPLESKGRCRPDPDLGTGPVEGVYLDAVRVDDGDSVPQGGGSPPLCRSGPGR